MQRKKFSSGCTLFIILLSGILFKCSPKQYPDSRVASCYPNRPYDTTSFQWRDPSDSVLNLLSKHYSRYSLMVANAAGLLTLLTEYEQEKIKAQNSTDALQRLVVLEHKEKIINRISLFRTQVASVAAELDCEGERADQLSVYVEKIDLVRTRNLTVASVVTGAVAGVAAALLQGDDANVVAITGGVASAVFGLFSLSSSKKVEFKHPRNLLHDLWFLPQHSRYYPATVWNMLSHSIFSNSKESSVAYNLRRSWQNYSALEPTDKKSDEKIKLLMGDGGLYSADDLKLRANMINQLQASVKLIDQDIQGLLSEVLQEKTE